MLHLKTSLPALVLATLLTGACPAQSGSGPVTPAPDPAGKIVSQERKRWIPGHYEKRKVTVRQPATTRRVWVSAVYRRSRDRKGNPIQLLVKPGRWKISRVPGRLKTETRRVWVPGRWVVGS